MEEDVSGAASFSDHKEQRSHYTEYLEEICHEYIGFGMTWDEFWFSGMDRLRAYWQAEQYKIEKANQQLWLSGLYIRAAVASVLNSKNKYPDHPHRITEMTASEKEAENRRKVEELREALMAHKRRWDASQAKRGEAE